MRRFQIAGLRCSAAVLLVALNVAAQTTACVSPKIRDFSIAGLRAKGVSCDEAGRIATARLMGRTPAGWTCTNGPESGRIAQQTCKSGDKIVEFSYRQG